MQTRFKLHDDVRLVGKETALGRVVASRQEPNGTVSYKLALYGPDGKFMPVREVRPGKFKVKKQWVEEGKLDLAIRQG